MAVEANGDIRVATLINGGITVSRPKRDHRIPPRGRGLLTNICLGGPDLRTAYITLSGYGFLIEVQWPRPGLQLEHQTA